MDLIELICLSLSVLSRLLQLSPQAAMSSEIASSLSARPAGRSERHLVAVVAHYIYHRHSPQLPSLATKLLSTLSGVSHSPTASITCYYYCSLLALEWVTTHQGKLDILGNVGCSVMGNGFFCLFITCGKMILLTTLLMSVVYHLMVFVMSLNLTLLLSRSDGLLYWMCQVELTCLMS